MTRRTLKYGKIRYGALIFSIAAHSTVLAVFTGVNMSSRTAENVSPQPALTLQVIERIVTQSAPKPKPQIKPAVAESVEKTPLVTHPEPVEPMVPQAMPKAEHVPVLEAAIEDAPPAVNEVEFFGQKSIVRRICYVVDCSGSMYGQMHQVKDQLRSSILKLNSQQAFAVVFFMEGRKVLTTGGGQLQPATARAKSQALEQIASIRPSGSTEAEPALETAMRLKDPDGRGPELIYFLTDGFDLDPKSSQVFAEKVRRLRQTLAPDAALHTIGFWPQPQDRQTLQWLAQNGHGEFIEIN